jgi:TRAP-type C4-dicarboxylate transport system permease small subunit
VSAIAVGSVPDRPEHAPARALAAAARWVEVYSQAAVGIARVGTALAVSLAILALAGNVFTRNVLGYSIFGAEELARFAFLWSIWMGVSLAVKRGAVTVITFVAGAGPGWWQRSVRTFSGVSLAILLLYACVRSTEYATGQFVHSGSSPSLGMSWFYPVVSMTVGYYFITLHYFSAVLAGAARLAGEGRQGVRTALAAAAGALVIGVAVWGLVAGLLEPPPFDPALIGPRHVVVDTVYHPAETPLLAAARARGATAENGVGMLVGQAALAFTLVTGLDAPLDVMRRAVGAP